MWKMYSDHKKTVSFLAILAAFTGFCLAGPEDARSQGLDLANAGSFYSGFGFGAPSDNYSPHTMGMGLTGVSTFSEYSPNVSNPAVWGFTNFTQGSVSLGITNFSAEDYASSAKNAVFGIDNFQMVLPVKRNRLGISLGFTPVARSNFKRIERGSFLPVPGLDLPDIEFEATTVGKGGINRAEIGLGYRVANFLSFGYAFSAHILSLEQETFPLFSERQYNSQNSFTREIEGYDFGHRFGTYIRINNFITDEGRLALGGTVTLPVSIDAERSVTSYPVNNTILPIELNENSANREGKIEFPLEFNTGLTYYLNRFVNFTAELQLQDWENAEFSYNPDQELYYKNRVKGGLGFQYHPYMREQFDGFFSNFRYSLGTSYDTGHLSINGQNIETLFFNAGIGLMSQSASSIDLSFQYGIRGTQSSNLVKENIWGFKLSLNLAELMFRQTRFQ